MKDTFLRSFSGGEREHDESAKGRRNPAEDGLCDSPLWLSQETADEDHSKSWMKDIRIILPLLQKTFCCLLLLA